MLLDTKKFVESKINEIQPRSVLQNGDVLTNIVGASIGRSAIFDRDDVANINQAVALIRLTNAVNRKYILHVLNSPVIIEHMESEKVDVARANLSLKDVGNYPIPLPPLNEQEEVVRRVEALFALADQIEARFGKAKARVDQITQSLLAKAFRGELVPQNPNDEPASALLERIKAERAKREMGIKGKQKERKKNKK
jgi:type I restriction enzyme S subunit